MGGSVAEAPGLNHLRTRNGPVWDGPVSTSDVGLTYRFLALFLAAFLVAFRAARRLVTRVAAVLLVEEDPVPRFLGEIFFSAIRFTPYVTRPVVGMGIGPDCASVRPAVSVSGITGPPVMSVTPDPVTLVTPLRPPHDRRRRARRGTD